MKRLLSSFAAAAFAATSIFAPIPATAAEVGFVEDYALAKDRTAALKQLIPGTDDHYYYHCLYHQSLEQFDQVAATLDAWRKQYPNSNYPPRYWEIVDRQALLTYDKSPDATLAHLRQRLNIQFNHNKEQLGVKPNFATALDQGLISRDRLTQVALQRHGSTGGFEDNALEWLLGKNLHPNHRREVLSRLQRPDVDGLVGHVVADLRHQYSGGFGSMNIHRQLLLTQLEDLLKQMPELLNQHNFVNAYLTKLQPNPDIDWRNDLKEYGAYLDRLSAFTQRLGPAFNSLKAHVMYHRLALDRQQNVYDRQRFMAYIALPKYVSYINNKYMELEEHRRWPCDLNANYQPFTLLPVVGNDEPLIRTYLHQFFEKDTGFNEYATYINDTYLKHNFAEVKIVNGLGDAEQWYRMIPPSLYQQIKDRIDIDFALTNKENFSVDEPVSVDLYVKNVKTLLVKVYEINAANFYKDNFREIDTDINLDGLVANKQSEQEYAEAPVRRMKRHFEFAELNKPGVYVIDFIGNGKSSRVLVRKGKLRFVERTSTAGHVFSVLNEKNEHLKSASLWLAGHEYKADKEGQIAVPFSNQGGRTPIVLTSGGYVCLDNFNHLSENYQLVAGIHVDREQLIKRKKASVLIRAGLYVNGTPATLGVLEDVTLVINSVDHDGVATTKEVSGFKLFEDRDALYEFNVPDRLRQLQFMLKAKVQNLSRGKKDDLIADKAFTLNEIDQTDKVEDLHLANMGGMWVIDLFGKTGEPRPDRPVNLTVKHREFRDVVQLTVQTNAGGRVMLGALKDIDWVQASGPEGTSHQWFLPRDQHSYQSYVHGRAGEALNVPYVGASAKAERAEVSLLELRGDVFVEDRFKSVTVANGFIRIDDLPRGDYDLLLKDSGQRIRVRLTEGQKNDTHVLSDYRNLEVRNATPLQISKVDVDAKEVKVKLENAGKFARVHVFGTRMLPDYSPWNSLNDVGDPDPGLAYLGRVKSAYVAGRNLGDEYRYILERKYMKIYPGNMLNRPGLLLNPWAIRATETGEQIAQGGDFFGGAGGSKASESERGGLSGRDAGGAGNRSFANLDFLGETSAVLLNLTPDKDGFVTVKREDLGDRQHIHVVAIDPKNTVYRSVALAEPKSEFVDLRLQNGLDPKQHFTEQKQISVVRAGEKFLLKDITTSKFEAYDTLSRVYGLFVTLSNDQKLIEFSFILNWPKMKPEEKFAKYSQFACHELNVFLFKKDPEFFAKVVLPYLANKRDKTFMDQWLLNNASAHYLEAWEHGRLNIAERILLGQKLGAEQAHTARHVKDLYDLIPPNIDHFNHLFQTALKGSALETGDTFGLAAQLEKQMPETKLKSEMFRADRAAKEGASYANGIGGGRGNDPGRPAPTTAAAPRPAAPPPPGAAPKPMDDSIALAEEADEKKDAAASSGPAKKRQREAQSRDNLRRLGDAKGADKYFDDDAERRKSVRQLYRKLDKTQEWVENNYYKLPIEQQNADLVSVNGFWSDYAKHDPKQPFYSTKFAESSRNFSDMLLALAVLDVPFEAGQHESKFDKASMSLTAATPMVVFHKEIKPAAVAKHSPVLVSQNFFRHNDRYRQVENERQDKYVTDEFLVHVVYGAQVVVTNPSSSSQKLDILLQVPTGAMPVLNGQYTKGVHVQLAPFSTQAIEYYFYFPAPGTFVHYPVHVARNEQAIAFAQPFEFKVVRELTNIDKESWEYISQHGSDDDVIAWMQANNINRVNLQKIAFRMKDKAFFDRAIALLGQRHVYNHTLFSYGFAHKHEATIREFLQHSDSFVAGCGDWLESKLLTIDPVERRTFEFMEYKPLVNARAHQLGKRRQIVNERMAWQYHRLLKVLTYKRAMDDNDQLAASYYLLLQDRVDDAGELFGNVNPQRVATKIQYDLMATYLDFYNEEPKVAAGFVEKYKEYPVDKWKQAFAAAGAQLEEIQGKSVAVADKDDRNQQTTQLAATEPTFDFNVEAKKINITYANLKQVQVNYYLMDVELLFSRSPFVQQFGGEFAYIKPNDSQVVNFNEKAVLHSIPLPEKFHNANVLVEIVGAGQNKSRAYYSNAMTVQVIENYGQVKVAQASTGKALPKTYVKVYAMTGDGQVKFYKDGYTDLRGRFDFTSLNTNDLDNVQKFSVLVLSEQHGAVVREAQPPKQ